MDRLKGSLRISVGLITAATFVLTLALVAVAQLAPGGTFVDDNGNPHEPNIEAVAAGGITAGCDVAAALYCPNSPVTRAEMAVFLIRALGQTGSTPTHQGYFADVPSSAWYGPSVERLFELGVTTGLPDGSFNPGGSVSRAEMGAFLVRAFSPSIELGPHKGYFADIAESDWYSGYAEALLEMGITAGCAEGLYCPAGPVLRDQMASFLARALGLDPIYAPLPTTTLAPSTTVPTTTTLPTTTTTWGGGSGTSFWNCSSGFSGWSCSGDTDKFDFGSEFWSCTEGFSGFSCSGNIDKTDFGSEFWSCTEGFSGFSCSGNVDKRDFGSEFWSCTDGFSGISCSGNIDKGDFATEFWSCSSGFSGFSCSGDVDKMAIGVEFWSCSSGFSGFSCSGDPGFLAPIVSPVPLYISE